MIAVVKKILYSIINKLQTGKMFSARNDLIFNWVQEMSTLQVLSNAAARKIFNLIDFNGTENRK